MQAAKLISSIFIALLLLQGCGGNDSEAQSPVEITDENNAPEQQNTDIWNQGNWNELTWN